MDGTADPIRVLHVDDDRAFGELAAEFLQREHDGLDVTTVATARKGLDVFDAEPVDCIVSDYDMPGRDGLSFLEAVRERNEEIPFVLFTGQGDESVASEAISAGVTDYLQKGTGADQYAILANRIANVVAAYRAQRRAARQERISTLLREVNRRLVEAVTVDGIERAVCEVLAKSYRFAWIGRPDPETGEVRPLAAEGDGAGYLDEVTIYHDGRRRGWGPTGMAVRTREIQLVQDVPGDPSFEPWRETVSAYGFGSVVVLPLRREDALHGVLEIYADRANAFTEIEREVFAELAETVGRALDAVHVRRRLRSHERGDAEVAERYLRTIAAGLPGGAVALFDTDVRYTVVEGAVFDDLAVPVSSLTGTPLQEAHSEAFRAVHLHHYRAALAGERRTFESEHEGRVFRTCVGPVRDGTGTVVSGLALTRDVTEERVNDRALARRDERLGTLVEDIRALARPTEAAVDAEPVDLEGVMADAWERVDTGAANAVVTTDRVARADRARLRRLLEHLVRNCVDHGSTGGRTRTNGDRTGRTSTNGQSGDAADPDSTGNGGVQNDDPTRDTSGPTVRLGAFEGGFYVEDDGPGIPPGRRETVFEPGHSTRPDGTGLGLTVVERLAEAHGWSVSVAEGTDGGTRVAFTGVEFER
jgi:signal transduction histidine kinase/DNA-binding response OmpR family regulator